MMKILVAYDGSQGANAALSDLQRAGLPREAEGLLISVADVMMTPETSKYELAGQALVSRRFTSGLMYAERQATRVHQEAREFASQGSARLRSLFPYWSVRSEVLTGTAWSELIRKANEWEPDLVVLGSQGRTALGRFVLGSVSTKVATASNYSVRVAREPAADRLNKPPRIMIAVDGSVESERAIREVGSRVWPAGTEVRIIFVDEGVSLQSLSPIAPSTPELIDEEKTLTARNLVHWAQSELSAIGLDTSSYIDKGDPKTVLIEKAIEWNVDSIFVGARRFTSAFERFWLGSVSTALVTKAHSSVEVVRAQSS